MKKSIIVLICCVLFLGCKQISKSISDTFKVNDTLVSKEFEKPDSIPAANTQPDVNAIIKTVLETHSTILREHHIESEGSKGVAFLTNTNGLKKAEEALRKLPQYKGKEIFIYSTLHFYNDGTINVMLQHPENPKYVDAYEFSDNKWSEPRPVQLSVRDDIQNRLISLNKINFTSAAKVTEIYNKKVQEIEGAKPATSVYISIWDNQIRWYPTTINGSRERYSIQFNDDGTLKAYRQD